MSNQNQHSQNATNDAGVPPAPSEAHQAAGGVSMILKIGKNCMGTTDFDGKFIGMRKPQNFSVYPIGGHETPTRLKIQSDTRIGYLDLTTGAVSLCKPQSGGAYNVHLHSLHDAGTLPADELASLKTHVFKTAKANAGTRGVTCDNAGAINILPGFEA